MVKRGYKERINNAYSAAKLGLYNQEVELEEASKCGRDWERKTSSGARGSKLYSISRLVVV